MKDWGAQTKIQHQFMKLLIISLSQVGRCKQPDWRPWNNGDRRLETIGDTDQHYSAA